MEKYLLKTILIALFFLSACQNSNNKNATGELDKQKLSPMIQAEAETPEKNQSLREAALEGNSNEVKRLVLEGANINATDEEGRDALMLAAYNGHTNILSVLLDHGADVQRIDSSGRTALMYASTGPFPEAVKLLLDQGAKPNLADKEEHFTALMYAASEGNLEVVKILVENGADPSLTDIDDDNALNFARNNGHDEVVGFLEKKRTNN